MANEDLLSRASVISTTEHTLDELILMLSGQAVENAASALQPGSIEDAGLQPKPKTKPTCPEDYIHCPRNYINCTGGHTLGSQTADHVSRDERVEV